LFWGSGIGVGHDLSGVTLSEAGKGGKGGKGHDLSGEAISEEGKMALKNLYHKKHRIHKNVEGVEQWGSGLVGRRDVKGTE